MAKRKKNQTYGTRDNSKKIRLLEKEAVDCIEQKKSQDKWLW